MKKLDELKEVLEDVANRDNVITDDEQNLLERVNNFIRQYHLYEEKANEDGTVDKQEIRRLKEMRRGILEGAWVEAMADGDINDDESEILSTIYEFLKDFKL